MDYVEDEDSDENEDTDDEVWDYDAEDVEEDDNDENNNAQTAKSSYSDTSRKISISNSMSKISLTEKTLILVRFIGSPSVSDNYNIIIKENTLLMFVKSLYYFERKTNVKWRNMYIYKLITRQEYCKW